MLFRSPDITFPAHDPEEAQRLFDELAAEGTPVDFTIVTPGGDAGRRAVAIQTQLSTFDNVEVGVEAIDASNYGRTLYGGDFDMAAYGFRGLDPEPQVASMRTTHQIPIASLGSAVVDEAVAEGRSASDTAGRKAAYDKLTRAMIDEYRIIFEHRLLATTLEAPDVTGIVAYNSGSPLFAEFGYVA